ncbi:MAG TPA: YidC/Oxa1 family insertase periplasmic-domain containing protein [Blastocatellia bacterium]
MERTRLLIACLLSVLVIIAWPLAMHFISPSEEQPPAITQPAMPDQQPQPESSPTSSPTSAAPTDNTKPPSGAASAKNGQPGTPAPQAATTQVPQREITISSNYWTAKVSNHGADLTSWIISKERLPDGTVRPLRAANGGELQLIPQDIAGETIKPFDIRLPGYGDLAGQLNQVDYQIEGIDSNKDEVDLGDSGSVKLTFTYQSPSAVVHKTFTFFGGRLFFDVTADVKANGADLPTELVIGPRIGDQTDKAIGAYSEPPGLVTCQADDKVTRLRATEITPPFGKVTAVDAAGKRIQIDKPLAADVDRVKLDAADGKTSLGYARVLDRDPGSHLLTLDSIPAGTAPGCRVAQGTDTIKRSILWAGATDHYFAMVAVPDFPVSEVTAADYSVSTNDQAQPIREYPSIAIPVMPGSGMRVFVGPKDRHILGEVSQEVNANLEALINYGFFAFMVRPLAPLVGAAFNFGSKVVGNYGWSIVIVTVLMNLLLLPLRMHSSKKMKSAAKHQPKIKELQDRMKKLKENPKRNEREIEQVQREQMELMKEANPLGGCLPMLLQMPIFWAIYLYLEVSLDVRQQPWILWIKDLSVPDPLKILPVIMCVSMIGSSMLQPQPGAADPSQKMQRMMMTWMMPIFMTWLFFFSAPSGLTLYWMVSNLAGVALQFAINKRTAEGKVEGAGSEPGKKGKSDATGADGSRKKSGAKGGPKQGAKVGEKEMVGGIK